jgi:DNA-binding NarL/FixJ family response regulator
MSYRILTPRQWEVLALLAEGLTDLDISCRLGIKLTTVEQHVKDVRAAYGASNRTHVVAMAMREGDIS